MVADVERQRKGVWGGARRVGKDGSGMSGTLRVRQGKITSTHIYVRGSPGTKRAHILNMCGSVAALKF